MFLQLARKIRKAFSKKETSSWETYSEYVKIHPTAIIDPTASIKLFNPPDPPEICLEIGEGCHIFSRFHLLRPQSKIKIGNHCQLGNGDFVCADSIEVSDDVIMAWGFTIIDSDNHSIYWDERKYDVKRCMKDYIETNGHDLARSHDWDKVDIDKVVIKCKSWLGVNTMVLKGVTIGDGAIIGAGSIVTKDVKPWHIAAGNPARHIRAISEKRSEDG